MSTAERNFLLQGDFVYRDAHPMEVTSARGISLGTRSGRTMIDLHASGGACMLGYRSDLLSRAAAKLESMPSKPQICESPARVELATRIAGLMHQHTGFWGAIGFDLGGAQAIEQALKIVSARSGGANTIFVLDGAYHGRSIATAHLSCSPRYHTGTGPAPFRIIRLPVPAIMARVLECDMEMATALCQREIAAIFNEEQLGAVGGQYQVHSFIFEPLLNVAGLLPVDPAYLALIIANVKRLGGAVIADEIFTGYYKTAHFLGSLPLIREIDIVVLSKVLTNGLTPFSAIWVKDESGLAQHYRPGIHSSTFINGELGIAIASEVLSELALLTTSDLTAPATMFERLFMDLDFGRFDAKLIRQGNTAKLEFRNPNACQRYKELIERKYDAGVLTASTGLALNALIFHPAFVASEEEIRIAESVIQRAVADFD